jgi:Mg/Co/Ni transporter MgtE
MWFWRSMEKISWTDRVRNEYRVKEERNILHVVKQEKRLIGLIIFCVGTAF